MEANPPESQTEILSDDDRAAEGTQGNPAAQDYVPVDHHFKDKRNELWKNFDYSPSQKQFRCLFCVNHKAKKIAHFCKSTSLTNLRTHLERKHPSLLVDDDNLKQTAITSFVTV